MRELMRLPPRSSTCSCVSGSKGAHDVSRLYERLSSTSAVRGLTLAAISRRLYAALRWSIEGERPATLSTLLCETSSESNRWKRPSSPTLSSSFSARSRWPTSAGSVTWPCAAEACFRVCSSERRSASWHDRNEIDSPSSCQRGEGACARTHRQERTEGERHTSRQLTREPMETCSARWCHASRPCYRARVPACAPRAPRGTPPPLTDSAPLVATCRRFRVCGAMPALGQR